MAASKSTSLLFAVALAFASAACGPAGKSIPKALMGASNDSAAESSTFLSGQGASSIDTYLASDTVNEETLYFSNRGAPSPFAAELAEIDNASIPADGRVEITRDDLASLRTRGGVFTREVHDFLPLGVDRLNVRVIVALNRLEASMPGEDYQPQASVTVTHGADGAQTLTLTFENSDELDAGAEFPENILSDIRKIVILRMP